MADLFGSGAPAFTPEDLDPAMPVDDGLLDKFTALKQSQERSLQEHGTWRRNTDRALQATRERQADLSTLQQFNRAVDPTLPKAARTFLWSQFVRSIGGDPKSASARELGQLLHGLDPDSLGLVRRVLADAGINANSPSAIRELLSGVVSGRVPAQSILDRVQSFAAQEQSRNIGRVEGAFPQGQVASDFDQQPSTRSEQPLGSDAGTTRQPRYAPPGGPTGVEIAPELSSVLPGLEVGKRYRWQDAADRGYTLPSDPTEMRKLSGTIRSETATTQTLLTQVADLHALVKGGGAEALSPAGWAIRSFEAIGQQVGAVWDSATGARLQSAAKDAARNVMRIHGLTPGAETAARVESLVTRLAYQQAKALDPSGRLSDQDVEIALRMMGNSASPEQFKAVLKDVSARAYDAYADKMSAATGAASWNLDVARLPTARLAQIGTSETTPPELRRVVREEYEGRIARGGQPAAGSVRAAEEVGRRGASEVVEPVRDTKPRRGPTIEDEEASIREQAAAAVAKEEARLQRGEDRSERSLALSEAVFEYRKSRDDKEDAEKQQAKLQAAIRAFASDIASSGSSASISIDQPRYSGQDGGAFVIPNRPTRVPPRIPSRRQRNDD